MFGATIDYLILATSFNTLNWYGDLGATILHSVLHLKLLEQVMPTASTGSYIPFGNTREWRL